MMKLVTWFDVELALYQKKYDIKKGTRLGLTPAQNCSIICIILIFSPLFIR